MSGENLRWQLSLRLYRTDKSFGPGPMRLLQGVRETGSLHRAAEQMGMAYSKAWTLLRHLEEEWGFSLLERQAGGAHGGFSRLTDQGADLLTRYEAMLHEVEQAAEQAFARHFPGEDAADGSKKTRGLR